MDPKVVIYAKKHISLIPKNAYLKVERKEGKNAMHYVGYLTFMIFYNTILFRKKRKTTLTLERAYNFQRS